MSGEGRSESVGNNHRLDLLPRACACATEKEISQLNRERRTVKVGREPLVLAGKTFRVESDRRTNREQHE